MTMRGLGRVWLVAGLAIALLATMFVLATSAGPADAQEQRTIAEIASENEDLTTLVTALEVATEAGAYDFLGAVSDPGATLTVFAPTDDAFAALGDTLGAALADPGGLLTTVLSYHVVGTAESANDLIEAGAAPTLQGTDVAIEVRDGNVFINNSQVVMADIPASNGIIHVIDAVLLPSADPAPAPEPGPDPEPEPEPQPEVEPTIAELVQGNPDLSTLLTALIAASEAGQNFLGTVSDPDANLTVFAPTDDAFAALGDTLGAALADPGGLLSTVLAYHVLATPEAGADLVAAGSATTLLGQDVTIELRGDDVYINNSRVILADVEASNGIVHVIDAVLIPELASPEPAPEPPAPPAPEVPAPPAPEAPAPAPEIDENQRPFVSHVAPGRIQAERFDTGGEGIAYGDKEPENRGNSTVRAAEGVDIFNFVNSGASSPIIGSTRGGEWTEYTVFAPEAGEYELIGRVASGFSAPGFIRARVNNTPVGTISGDTSGWFDWRERSFGTASFVAGENVVRMAWNGGGQVNFDWFEVNRADDAPTIAEIAVGDDRFSTLVTALSAASDAGPVDFLSVVSDPDADITVFAPTNDAFAALGETLGAALADPSGLLTQVLSYHVLGTSEYATDLAIEQSAVTLADSVVRISVRPGGVFINDSKVIISNIAASNGIVHVIDAVLLPPAAPTCAGLLQEAEDGVLWGNFAVVSPAPTARGGAYIEAPDGSGPANGDDFAEFCVTVDEPGIYRIDVLVRGFDNTDDSFFVQVDNGPKALFDSAISSTWVVDSVSARGIANPVRYQLDAGDHIVRFYQRENGTQLDAFRVTATSGAPSNLR